MLYPTYLRRSDPFALMRSMMRDLDRGFWPPSRTIRLPFATSDDKVEARMTNGVLRIVISRPEEEKPKKIEIKAA